MGDTDVKETEASIANDHTQGKWNFPRVIGFAVAVLSLAMGLFHFYTAGFGILEPLKQRIIHVTFALVLAFLLYPPRNRKTQNTNWWDVCLALISLVPIAYMWIDYERIVDRIEYVDPITLPDHTVSVLLMVLVLVATRRVIGMPMVFVVLAAVVYTFVGQWIPGVFGHTGLIWNMFIDQEVMTMNGLFSVPIAVSSTYVVIFVLFGAILVRTGMGEAMIDMAKAISGHTRGGPAKVAVISSGLFGSINGSSIANVVATGSFTIPLMKGIGYRAHFAGAVESAASIGGQFMPPVMGAAAFIMVEVTGINYLTIIVAAAVPACLYYAALLFAVHYEAGRLGLPVLERFSKAQVIQMFLRLIPFLIPVGVLLGVLIRGHSPIAAGFYATLTLIAVSTLSKKTRLDFRGYVEAFKIGAKNAVVIAITCAAAGIVIGIVYALGIGIKFASTIISISGGQLLLALPLVMISSLLLGMGLPTSACYVLVAAVAAPVLEEMGVPQLPTHLFVLYFGCISSMTPPVAVAAYAAAGIAGCDPMRTGVTAFRLGIAGFIIPYLFVFWPALMWEGTWYQILLAVVPAFFGIVGLAAASIGWLYRELNPALRLIFLLCALMLMVPGIYTDTIGAVIMGALVIYLRQGRVALPRTTMQRVVLDSETEPGSPGGKEVR
jgi:TRAP transporter 4TM/12TM fusion protein